MDRSEAQERLQEYADRARRIQRRFIAPTMLFFAAFAFAFLVTGGFGPWWANGILVGVSIAWIVYARKLTGVTWTRMQNLKLTLTLVAAFCWVIVCNAYFVNWNPHDLPAAGLLGGLFAAVPLLVLARTYRP